MEIHIKLIKMLSMKLFFGMLTEVSIAGTITLDRDCSKIDDILTPMIMGQCMQMKKNIY